MRFVIHHHVTNPEHFDLMIEKEDSLHTWQIPLVLFQDFEKGLSIEVKKIQDHRKEYLDYEGPISCDRGIVKIYDSGNYVTRVWEPESIILELMGEKLKGILNLKARKNLYQIIFKANF